MAFVLHLNSFVFGVDGLMVKVGSRQYEALSDNLNIIPFNILLVP